MKNKEQKSTFPFKPFVVFLVFGIVITCSAFLPEKYNYFPSVKIFYLSLFTAPDKKNSKEILDKEDLSNDIDSIEKRLTIIHPSKIKIDKKKKVVFKPVNKGDLQHIPGGKFIDNPCLKGGKRGCSGWALDSFYKSLQQTSNNKKITRISYFGDSVICLDKITSKLRQRFQNKFGDSGPGFFHMAALWKWTRHKEISLYSTQWKTESILVPKRREHFYGYGGIIARTIGPGAVTVLSKRDGVKTDPNTMYVYYIKDIEGGKFLIKIDKKIRKIINTRGTKELGQVVKVSFNHGSSYSVEAGKGGVVKITGIVLENSNPGVVVDSISLTGARFVHLTNNNPLHYADVIKKRKPDLMIFHFGINEADTGLEPDYGEKVGHLIQNVKRARPELSCLVAGPSDKVSKKYGEYRTKKIIHYIIKKQREIALKNGCAFFNTWEAMGGEASIVKWYHHHPRLAIGDLTHITDEGGDLMGSIIYLELIKGYSLFLSNESVGN